jgi:hypothetical protein
VAALNHLSGVDKMFRDAAPGDEAGLVGVDQPADLGLQPQRKSLAHHLHGAVLL